MLPRNTFLDFAHATAVVKEIAKFHAGSFKLWSGTGEAILEEFSFLKESLWLKKKDLNRFWITFLENTFPEIGNYLASKGFPSEGQVIAEAFQVDEVIQRMEGLTRIPTKYPSVIIHGDLWVNNVLFKYNNAGIIQSLKFVDLQASKVGSRILDLSYLLYSSVRNDVLNRNLPDLLQTYFQIFEEEISSSFLESGTESPLTCPISFNGDPFTWQKFVQEWEEYKYFGLTMAILYSPAMLAVEENIPDLETLKISDLEGPKDASEFSKLIESPYLLSRLVNLAKHHISSPFQDQVMLGSPV